MLPGGRLSGAKSDVSGEPVASNVRTGFIGRGGCCEAPCATAAENDDKPSAAASIAAANERMTVGMMTIWLKTIRTDEAVAYVMKRLTASCIPSSYRRVRMQ